MRASVACASSSRPPAARPTKPPRNTPPLWRFILLAAIIVIVAGSAIVAQRRAAVNIRISATPVGTPTPTVESASSSGPAPRPRQTFTASAPWALSALTDCFTEGDRTSGPLAKVRPLFPSERERVLPGTQFERGPCRVEVHADSIIVVRGADRMRVPHGKLYRTADHLIVVSTDGPTADMRTY
jgi:hypothetical protein